MVLWWRLPIAVTRMLLQRTTVGSIITDQSRCQHSAYPAETTADKRECPDQITVIDKAKRLRAQAGNVHTHRQWDDDYALQPDQALYPD